MSAFVTQRREDILNLLSQHESMSVADLSDHFGVSPLTIRRDLNTLARMGVIERKYGSAKLLTQGDTVFINTSTTALGVLEFVTAENVTFVTNSGRALHANLPPSSTVILTGGEIRVPKWSMTGDFALANIANIKANKCIVGCSGFSAQRGLTTNVAQEKQVNALMLDHAEFKIAVADNTKIDNDSNFVYGEAAQLDVLVTNAGVQDEQVQAILQAGVGEVIRV